MIRSKNVLAAVMGYTYSDLLNIVGAIKNDNSRSKYYYSYEKKKANGKVRIIAPSCNELKDIQNRLVDRIFSHVQFPYYITGSIRKRSGVINAKLHSGKQYHLQTDLVGFFDFVGYRQVYSAIREIGFSADIARIVTGLTTYKGHLPQGAPTSPFLANLVGLSIDNTLLSYCAARNITYSRYVDDITFSSENDFKTDVERLLTKIKELGYLYSHPKTLYKIGKIQVTGSLTGCGGLSGTEAQLNNLFSPLTSQTSRDGTWGHLQYIAAINKNFKLTKYKNAFAELSYPTSLWPFMNKKTSASK